MSSLWKTTFCLYIISLLAKITRGLDFNCAPVIAQGCYCSNSYSDDYQISCLLEDLSSFTVNIEPTKYVQVCCNVGPSLEDFYLNLTDKEVPVPQQLYIRYCQLPDVPLSAIAKRVNADKAEDFLFETLLERNHSLRRDHLSGFPNLKRLIMSSNGFTDLPEDVFAEVPGLTRLSLRANDLKRLPAGIFRYTPLMREMELGMNLLEALEPGMFDTIPRMVLLNMWRNRLRHIPPGIFDKLTLLRGLDVNSNRLEELDRDLFAKLVNLETINLFGNNFTSLPDGLFRNNKKLRKININYNARAIPTLPDGFFANLTGLQQLMIKKSGLERLPENIFHGCTILKSLELQMNFLTELPESIFRDLRTLEELNLGLNRFRTLPDNLFEDLSSLQMLDLSKNRLEIVTRKMFASLTSLKELYLHGNQISTIQDQSFYSLTNLQIVALSNNKLTLHTDLRDEFGKRSPFHKCSALTELYLDHNNISDIFADWVISSIHLRKLDLNHNNIQRLEVEDLQFVSPEVSVDLSHNRIEHVYLSRVELIASGRSDRHRIDIILNGNPLSCDCYLYDLLLNLEGKMSNTVKNLFSIEAKDLRCASPTRLANTRVVDLHSTNFTCSLPDKELQDQCPGPCTCSFRPDDKAYLIDCSRRNLTDAPGGVSIPKDLRVELDLTGNRLVQLPRFLADNVVKLVLKENRISAVPINALAIYKSTLEVLELHNNNLSSLSSEVLSMLRNFTSLRHLTLHSNPWICDCGSRDLFSFVQTTKVLDSAGKSRIICADFNKSISELTLNEVCPFDTETIIAASLSVALLGVMIGGAAALYYRYQREIRVWLYAHRCCLCLVTEDELDKDKVYDAFVSYSHKDEEFIVNELVPGLESRGPRAYKLCLHYRDWRAGDWIPAQIARSVEESRRTVIVLSPNFLDSVWGRMEFRAAHNQALSEGRARVIVILYGEVGPTDKLDPELRAYLSMNTYVKWGDPWFWDKLRYALPHSSDKNNADRGKKRFFENQQPSITVNPEKKDLARPLCQPETRPAEKKDLARPLCQPEMRPAENNSDPVKVFICDGKTKREISNKALIAAVARDAANVTPDKKIFRKIQCTTV